jgi:hypothetical protein
MMCNCSISIVAKIVFIIFRHHHPFLAAAAAARMNGFVGPPGTFPHGHHPMMGPPGPGFFRPPFGPGPHPHPHQAGQAAGEFHPPHPHPHPHPHMIHPHLMTAMGPHRPPYNPRQIMFMQQHHQNINPFSNNPHHNNNNHPGNPGNPGNPGHPGNTGHPGNPGNNAMLQHFHQSVVGDIRAGKIVSISWKIWEFFLSFSLK